MLASDLTYYQRNLPHWLPPGETLFLTFRLANSLPQVVLERLRAEYELAKLTDEQERYAQQRRYFGQFDAQLDKAVTDVRWLARPGIARLVGQALHFHHSRGSYNLLCYCIMANHVHMVVSLPEEAPSLALTLKSIKSFTGRLANQQLGRQGQFWQPETYDHIVRDGKELARVIAYVVNNPVKAGLVEDWQQWPYTYWAQ